MTKCKFIKTFTNFIKIAVAFCDKARREGLLALEEELEDLDDNDFKIGLRLVVDGTDGCLIDEIYSYMIENEKNKYKRRYKTIIKRAVLGIQQGINLRILILILLAIADLPHKEQSKIEYELLRD